MDWKDNLEIYHPSNRIKCSWHDCGVTFKVDPIFEDCPACGRNPYAWKDFTYRDGFNG